MTGMLVNGEWTENRDAAKDDVGIKNWITADGASGPTGNGGFKAEKDRYHLYVSYACPFAHRTLIMRKLKGLETCITVSYVDGMTEKGWKFDRHSNIITSDDLYRSDYLYEIYQKSDSKYTGKVSVPVLWDKKLETIVSNDSANIMRMFNWAFNDITGNTLDFCPKALRHGIDEISEAIQKLVNEGVYKAGFAKSQEAYIKAVKSLFKTLDGLEKRLETQQYLLGDQVTEADWRLFPTLFRFDAIYNVLFKCNLKRIQDYPALWGYLRELYQMEGISETCELEYTKIHYFVSMKNINPNKIVPLGPKIDFLAPHNREAVVRGTVQQVPAPIQQTQKTHVPSKEVQRIQQEGVEKTGRIR